MNEHAVTLTDLLEPLGLDHGPDVVGGDDARAVRTFGYRQTLHATILRRIEQNAAADLGVLGDVLGAERPHAGDVADRPA
jgi:hypothetical protein